MFFQTFLKWFVRLLIGFACAILSVFLISVKGKSETINMNKFLSVITSIIALAPVIIYGILFIKWFFF